MIKGKQILFREIRETLCEDEENPIVFPKSMIFCEGMGQPMFKITIEKIENDSFIDEKGQKWRKVNE